MDWIATTPIDGLPAEIAYLALAVALAFVHICAQALLLTRDLGSAYNAGPRDEQKCVGLHGQRAERALRNYLETFPAFVALALAVTVADRADWWTGAGSALYFWSRVVYLPLYLGGIPYVRSLVWVLALTGQAILFWRLIG